ncbi:hypothetical protein [Clostridium magnum]|uniref:Amidase n=1 Tax=Clostridium magnum DSM 2767 TaxID=1121326 RepID=A0A162RYL3_9CLOT|nr:hypothetical protein [Clostridium magnum]KZL90551.1 hypothetical protein CLMAG_43230 [Clostridium magnum DSM 2767]SHI04939.1 hypothetical protein SAMN02745944_02245 [Clostridium magnum DSM 2767]
MKKFISLVLFLLITASMANFQVYAKQNSKVAKVTDSQTIRGTWLWNTKSIINEGEDIIRFLKDNKYNELYLQVNTDIKKEVYNKFIENASKNGIGVYALDGNPIWIFKDKRQSLNKFFDWVKKYNESSLQNQKFIGIHLDVEPYVLPEWSTKRDILVGNYQDYILYSLTEVNKLNLPFAVDVPFWFDVVNCGKENLAEWVISKVDEINIMAYRDKAYGEGNIIDICKSEMELSKRYNKKLKISVEIGDTKEGDFITFYQEGTKYMISELDKVNSYYKSLGYNFGFAVHSLDYLRAKK